MYLPLEQTLLIYHSGRSVGREVQESVLRIGETGVLKASHAVRESPKSEYFLKNPPLLWDIILTGQ